MECLEGIFLDLINWEAQAQGLLLYHLPTPTNAWHFTGKKRPVNSSSKFSNDFYEILLENSSIVLKIVKLVKKTKPVATFYTSIGITCGSGLMTSLL